MVSIMLLTNTLLARNQLPSKSHSHITCKYVSILFWFYHSNNVLIIRLMHSIHISIPFWSIFPFHSAVCLWEVVVRILSIMQLTVQWIRYEITGMDLGPSPSGYLSGILAIFHILRSMILFFSLSFWHRELVLLLLLATRHKMHAMFLLLVLNYGQFPNSPLSILSLLPLFSTFL